MTRIRVGTLNVENLFARFKFAANTDADVAVADGWRADQTKFTIHDDEAKKITGKLIRDLDADILCLQEVEGLDTLKRFRTKYLAGYRTYPYLMCIDGNDPRYIDVAVLSKYPIVHAETHQHRRSGRTTIFPRDCLEVDVALPGGKTLTVFNNHFTSMMKGRAKSKGRRKKQAAETKKIVKARFGSRDTGKKPFVICGDFNDYMEPGQGIGTLVNWNQVENVVKRRHHTERWTHFWNKKKEYRQLDYLLVSKSLAAKTNAVPEIDRRGLPPRARRYTGERLANVTNKRKASDHCPIVFDLEI